MNPTGFFGEAFSFRLFRRRRSFFRLVGVVVDVFDDKADDDHQRHGEEHARRVEEAAAEEQATLGTLGTLSAALSLGKSSLKMER